MAVELYIQGPTALYLDGAGSAPVGYTTNDDLFTVEVERLARQVQATDTGDEPAAFIHTGVVATITGTLSNWDEDEVDELLIPPGGTVNGDAGVIGTVSTNAVGSRFPLWLIPTDSGLNQREYKFAACYNARARILDMGNDNTKLQFQCTAFRDASGNIWTASVPT